MKYRWKKILQIIKEKENKENLNGIPNDYCVVPACKQIINVLT
jgi:hypothetical protein